MEADESKQPSSAPAEEDVATDPEVVDEGWSKMDLHNADKTPVSDLPSNIEA